MSREQRHRVAGTCGSGALAAIASSSKIDRPEGGPPTEAADEPDSRSASVVINGRNVALEWTRAAASELARRPRPLIVELELYFSCLVKKFVHFREDAGGRDTVAANDKLLLYFRPATSTACSFAVAERLGRQPEMDLHGKAVNRISPKKVSIDFAKGAWQGHFSL